MRLIQTRLRERAYGRAYATSGWRRRALARWMQHYDERRPHMSLKDRTPIARL